jgi:hypothetical protein
MMTLQPSGVEFTHTQQNQEDPAENQK